MNKLQECKTLQEAEPFLRGSSPTFRKTVETALLLQAHPDPAQQALGHSFMASAIQELDNSEKPTPAESHGLKVKGEHFVKEELLPDGNKSGNEGSEQSTGAANPTPKEGTTEPDGDMETPGMSTENQMTEAFPGQPQQMPGQMPGGQGPPMGPPGMDPSLIQSLMPQGQIPPMNTPQQIQQMQYTVKKYLETYLNPVREQVIRLTKANTFLSNQIKEMQTSSVGLDITKFSKENNVPRIQETLIPGTIDNGMASLNGPKIYEKVHTLEKARHDITAIDNMISSNGNQPYQ